MKKLYQVMDGGDLGSVSIKIMQHEADGWSFVNLLAQSHIVKPASNLSLNGSQPQAQMVQAFYPLMYKMVEDDYKIDVPAHPA